MRLARWLVVATLSIALACHEATSPRSSSTIGGNLVRLTVSSSAGQVLRGTPVTFHVILANEGSAPLTLHFSDSCQINPYIQDESGKTVLPYGGTWGCATVLTDLTLDPGGGVDREYVWTGSTAFQSEMPLRLLPAGKYLFSAEVPANETTLRSTIAVVLK